MEELCVGRLAQLGILVRSYGCGPLPHRSHVVYYRGTRVSPGEVQEDGFRSRSRAKRFAMDFARIVIEAQADIDGVEEL